MSVFSGASLWARARKSRASTGSGLLGIDLRQQIQSFSRIGFQFQRPVQNHFGFLRIRRCCR